MVDWKKLEDEVDSAIEKNDASSLNICYKTTEECKYIQKCAEVWSQPYSDALNITIFLATVAVAMLLLYFSINSYLKYIAVIIGLIFAYYAMKFLKSLLPIIIKTPETRRRIILEAEKRILSETDAEPRQTQLITNTPPKAQERIEPIAETNEPKYPKIWELYITLAVFFFTVYPVARDYVEKPSTFDSVLLLAVVWWLIFISAAIVAMLLFRRYHR